MNNFDIGEKKLLLKELKGCYDFFANEVNLNKNSAGYGLVRDKKPLAPEVCSIASVGYGLASLIVGVQHDWISFEDACSRASLTLKTFLNTLQNTNGFYYHFINIYDGTREWNSEVSIIDTGIFICGALAAGQFFGNETQELADKLYRQINWEWYADDKLNMFYMGYSPEHGFAGHWDYYAEQLILYILGSSSPTHSIDKVMYDVIHKPVGEYGEFKNIIHSWFGSLFTYQFSHAWIDFRDTVDNHEINWWDNSVKATLANRQYCIDNQHLYKTFGENSWGLTASVSPSGYSGEYGAMPASSDISRTNDGTIAPYGAISSIVFTPKESLEALKYYYSHPQLIGKYGLKASFNLNNSSPWYTSEYLSIDKGITLAMIENCMNESIWNEFMQNEYVKKGMDTIGIKKVKKQ